MKLSTRQRRETKLELSMTSMIDVVFLLLIFFLVTTTFIRPEKRLLSAIEDREQQSVESDSELEPAIVDVVRVDGRVVFRIGAVTSTDLDKIKPVLDSFDNKDEGAFVRVADDVPFDFAARAIGCCKSAGFVNVSYVPLK